MKRLALAGLVMALGCGGGDGGDGVVDSDAGADANQVGGCDELPAAGPLGVLFEIESGLQIHPWIRKGGDSMWLAYTATDIDDSNVFDTAVMRLTCSGEIIGTPIRATTTGGRSEIDPSMAVGEGSFAISWTADSSTAENNLDLVVRAFNFDGTPRTDSDITIESALGDGTPVVGNAFFSAIAAKPGGGFVLTSSTVLPGAPTFRAIATHLDADGQVDGPIVELASPGPDTHSELAVSAENDGTIAVAWTEARASGDVVMVAETQSDRSSTTLGAPLFANDGSSAPSIATIGGDRVYAVRREINGESDIVLQSASGATLSLGTAGALDHTPMLAAGSGDRGAVAYFRNLGGFRNQLVVVGFALEAGVITADAPVEMVHDTPAPPYAPTLAHIGEDLYFVAWAEGTSPEFTLRGAIAEL